MCAIAELDTMKRYFANHEEHSEFAQAVIQDVLNLDYQLYTNCTYTTHYLLTFVDILLSVGSQV